MNIQKSGTTIINPIISDEIRNLEGASSSTEIIIPHCIFRRIVTPTVIWWNTLMTSYWATPMTSLWNTHMDSVV